MNTDPIADFLTRIRNAVRAGRSTLTAPHSQMKESIAHILEEQNIIEKSRVDRSEQFPKIVVTLKKDKPQLTLTRISKPGLRVFQKASEIRPVRNGFGISIISTSKGLMTGDAAKSEGVGGEVLCEIY